VSLQPAPTARPPEDEIRRARDLARMKRTATGLLVGATVVFLVTKSLESDHSWLSYVRATAEAAMVGALADWFAVTALFRHPLGIPIPHTAIIPARKDDIGRGLGTFVQRNFLTADVVTEKLRGTSVAARLGAWLAEPANARRVGDQAATVLTSIVDALKDEEVQDAIEQALARKVRSTPAGPILGRSLELALADDRHQELLSSILHRVGESLDDNRGVLRERLGSESPWWVPDTIDDRVFERLFGGVRHLLEDIAADPHHELRAHFDLRLKQLAQDLETSPEMQAKAEALKEDLLAHPSVREWSGTVWSDLKEALLARAADPSSELRRRIEAGVAGFGTRLRDDESLQRKVDDWVVSAAGELAEQSRDEVGELIASTVARWDPAESSRRIELQVGRDLQFIRINGTVVGGLAGLLIYVVGRFLGG
jgi:uncharacterized membrane-anchored protein YjiN (DUF445 family)